MTGQNNPKKLKKELQSDAKVHISKISQLSEKDSNTLDAEKDMELFHYIETQGENSIKTKIERPLRIGDSVILTKDLPEFLLYNGYVCTIIALEKDYYEIEFESSFKEDDSSRKSEKRNVGFEFPNSCYITFVLGEDIIRVETQDLYYRTYF